MTAIFTLKEALNILQSPSLEPVTRRILSDNFAFWLGSGISRECFPNVHDLLAKVFINLHERLTPKDAGCPYLQTIRTIIGLTRVSGLDPNAHPKDWPLDLREELLAQLQEKYSEVLEQDVHHPTDGTISIRWDILKLPELYADPAVPPDAEHKFLALLIEEGIVSELITTNWDGLVEAAHEGSRGSKGASLQAIACNNEWNRKGCTARLIKIHGSARHIVDCGISFRNFLVATKSDIRRWTADDSQFRPFKDAVRMTLRERGALFIGLSAQDWNIQTDCQAASTGQKFPTNPPRVLFTEVQVTSSQRSVLRAIYGDEAYNRDYQAVERDCLIPLYGKPLLGGLFLITLLEKVKCIANVENTFLGTDHIALIHSMLTSITSRMSIHYDNIENASHRWRNLADDVQWFIARLLCMFRRQSLPRSRSVYEPLTVDSLGKMGNSPHPSQDLQWLFFCLSVLYEGNQRGLWDMQASSPTDGIIGPLKLIKGAQSIQLFLLQSDTGFARLVTDGLVDPNLSNYITIYPSERKRASKRVTSPARNLPGSACETDNNEIWMRSELEAAVDLDELFENLKLRVGVTIAA